MMIDSILTELVMGVANRLSYTFALQWLFRIYKLGCHPWPELKVTSPFKFFHQLANTVTPILVIVQNKIFNTPFQPMRDHGTWFPLMGLNFHILLSHVPETIVNPTLIFLSIERNFAILFNNFEQSLRNGSNWILDVLNTHYLNF